MADTFSSAVQNKLNSQIREQAMSLHEKQKTPFSSGLNSPHQFKIPSSPQTNKTFNEDKQKQNFSSEFKDEILEKNGSLNNDQQNTKKNKKYNPHQQLNLLFDQTIFEKAKQKISTDLKIQRRNASKSLSILQYKELISNASPSAIHLPAQRMGNQNIISEHACQDFNKTIKDGFTSFYQIKARNQDFLISLHHSRQSISNLVDLDELEMQRQITKQHEQLKVNTTKNQSPQPQQQKKQMYDTDINQQFKYENKDQIQLELEHNKAMHQTFKNSTQSKLLTMFRDVHKDQCFIDSKALKMPPIRKYPTQKRKEATIVPIQNDENELDQHLMEQRRLQEETKNTIVNYKVYFYTIPQNDWRPCAREGASLVLEKNKAYLFGGIGQSMFNNVEVLDLDQNLKWKAYEHNSSKNNIPSQRFGHTMNYHKGSLILFGGETHFNTSFKQRQCLMDMFFLNIEQKKWTFINISGESPCGRRCHTASVVGRWLIVHGGSNFRDIILSDVWAFDLATSSWQELATQCANGQKSKFPASAHTSCSVFYPSRQNKLFLFKYTDIKVPKWMPQIQHEGVYYFGGKDEEGKAQNSLRILKIESNPLQWVTPQTSGKPPSQRYGHTMTFNQLLNLVVICGGKNDQEQYLADVHLLTLESLTWLNVEMTGATQIPRSNHCAVCYDSKLILFGGLNLQGYLSSQVQMIELDEALSKQMMQKDQIKQKQQLDENRRIQKQLEIREALLKEKQKKNKGKSEHQNDYLDFQQYNYSNLEYGDIPFSSKKIPLANEEINYEKKQIEKLNFNNFVSFLPLPKQSTYGRKISNQRTLSQLLRKNTVSSPQNNKEEEVQQSPTSVKFQKTVKAIAKMNQILSSFNPS